VCNVVAKERDCGDFKSFFSSGMLISYVNITYVSSNHYFMPLYRYLKERKQFGALLATFQLNQEKLVCMLGNIQAMLLVGWQLCKLYELDKMI
jgi:hypothetical protein